MAVFLRRSKVPLSLKSLDLLLQVVATSMQLLSPVDRLALGVAGGLAAVRRQRLMDHISPIA